MELRLEVVFGLRGWEMEANPEYNRPNKPLYSRVVTGHNVLDVIARFYSRDFTKSVLTSNNVQGMRFTLGAMRILNSVDDQTLLAAWKTDGPRMIETDHSDGSLDFYVSVEWSKVEDQNKIQVGKIVSSWWKFGKAPHNFDHIIVHNDEIWYRMFGNFYYNTGKRP